MIGHYPKHSELEALITKVPKYPISASQLVELAQQKGAGQSVIKFFRSFPKDAIFTDKDDLEARAEQVELLNKEEQPEEILLKAED